MTILRKRIYLAGPDVFFVNVDSHFEELKALCLVYNLEGISPFNPSIITGTPTRTEIARRIYTENVRLVDTCDGMLANLMPFRGDIEPDSGTVFEVSRMVTRAKPIAGYLPHFGVTLEQKIGASCGFGETDTLGDTYDKKYGFVIENFGLPLNLMLSCSVPLFQNTNECLAYLKGRLGA